MRRCVNTVDLFCGAGGASTGMELALKRLGMRHRGLAINHWSVAVDTMQLNHPAIRTKRMSIEEAVPADLVPSGEVELLWASPSCTHHSRAKGGRPRSNQLRSQPELVLTWLDQLYVRHLIIENVPEFVDWGPLTRSGQLPWRGVRECLDFSDLGTSIFGRKKPLAANTMRRIVAGLRKYCGLEFQMDMLGSDGADGCRLRSIDEPLRTQHTSNRTAIVRPFIVKLRNSETVASVEDPLSTVSAGGQHHMLCRPFVLDHFRNGAASPISEPIGAQVTHDRFSMVTPMVLGQHGAAQCHSVDEPCPTVATRGAIRLITPCVIDMSHPGDRNDERRVIGGDDPLNTITTRNNSAAVMLPVLEDGRVIDIRIRMLKPEELAAAHSFPADYKLTGNRGDKVKQIGNSVPVMTAAAMCECDLRKVA